MEKKVNELIMVDSQTPPSKKIFFIIVFLPSKYQK